jgi:RimJ/RimL family protein N-acetyltransferase
MNSFNSQPINFDDHSKWYDDKLKNKNSLYLIGEIGMSPIGVVRFDKDKNGKTIVGVLIEKNYRGRNLAIPFLKLACSEYQKFNKSEIFAYIKKNNIASIRSFEKAGFTFHSLVNLNGIEAYKYKLEIHA